MQNIFFKTKKQKNSGNTTSPLFEKGTSEEEVAIDIFVHTYVSRSHRVGPTICYVGPPLSSDLSISINWPLSPQNLFPTRKFIIFCAGLISKIPSMLEPNSLGGQGTLAVLYSISMLLPTFLFSLYKILITCSKVNYRFRYEPLPQDQAVTQPFKTKS